MYVRKVISPTQAAKLCKKLIDPENKESTRTVIGKKTQWPQLEELITRKDGDPRLVPSSDPAPEISLGFEEADFKDNGDGNQPTAA